MDESKSCDDDEHFFSVWAQESVTIIPGEQCLCEDAYNSYAISCLTSEAISRKKFWRRMRTYFPKLDIKTVRYDKSTKKAYSNLSIEFEKENISPFDAESLKSGLSASDLHVTFIKEDNFKVTIFANERCDGVQVLKEALFEDGKVTYIIHGNVVASDILKNVYSRNVTSIVAIINVLRMTRLCFGYQTDKSDTTCTWTNNGNTFCGHKYKSCSIILPSTSLGVTCCQCYKSNHFNKNYSKVPLATSTDIPKATDLPSTPINTSPQPSPSLDINQIHIDEKDEPCKVKQLEKLLGELGLSPQRLGIVLDSCKNESERFPKRRRWDSNTIRTCLAWWCKDPKMYEYWRENGQLLPHPKTLAAYKNCLQQKPGLLPEMFRWMRQESERLGMTDDLRSGGIVFDEMSIQEDLTVVHKGCETYYSGLVSLTTDCSDLRILRNNGNKNIKLATHILQLVFVSHGGFRFPFAHFATTEAQAPELYVIFWRAVAMLQQWGFKTDFCCSDGANCNRQLFKLHFDPGTCINKDYTFPNICSPDASISAIMDPKHNTKKIRNNLFSSGTQSFHKRHLRLPHISEEADIRWEYWVMAYQWDTQHNSLPIHRKLTEQHIFPNSKEKMRNFLAEDVLDCEMLHLMKEYRNHLGAKGDHLTATIRLLEKTSVLVSFFNDLRPIHSNDDVRISQISDALQWFQTWEDAVQQSKIQKKSSALLTFQTREDIASLVLGFIKMTQNHFGKSDVSIVPGRVNSDIVENIFCQQRTLVNGSNTNPTQRQYGFGVNTIILGQTPLSRKRNCSTSATSMTKTEPYKKKPAV